MALARTALAIIALAGTIHIGPVCAQESSFDEWIAAFRAEAIGQGIGEATLDSAFSGLKPIPRVIELDRRQPEFSLTFRQYLNRVVPKSRVIKGRAKLAENRFLLEKIGNQYGVQPRFLVAFWGIETDFGRVTGGFPVVPALATLAYDGRRSAYFRQELFHALAIVDDGHIEVSKMVGSWAGAMGQCQFMPSSFVSFAVDGNNDGRKDIWGTKDDVFASAANYLARSGWKSDQTWGRKVQIPVGFDPDLANLKTKKKLSEWQSIGVRRADGSDLPKRELLASIVFTEGPGSEAYAVYDNFRSILKWNRSTYFAVAVGSLADSLKDR
jgi:peptidoglycan lytic transglycosylase B